MFLKGFKRVTSDWSAHDQVNHLKNKTHSRHHSYVNYCLQSFNLNMEPLHKFYKHLTILVAYWLLTDCYKLKILKYGLFCLRKPLCQNERLYIQHFNQSNKVATNSGAQFIELLNQKILLNNLLLSRNEQDTSHKFHMWHGSYAGNSYCAKHVFVVVSYFVCLSCSMKLGPAVTCPFLLSRKLLSSTWCLSNSMK